MRKPAEEKGAFAGSRHDRLPEDGQARLGWAYRAAGDHGLTEARFDAWAALYDQDVSNLLGWRGPAEAAKVTARFVRPDQTILDAGCGTGLVGEVLAAGGYCNVVGVDLSQSMLDIASAKQVYRQLHKGDLSAPLDFPDGQFDAVLAIGTSGYLTGEVIMELVRLVRAGGHIIHTISDSRYREGGFEQAVSDLEARNIVEIAEIGEPFAAIPRSEPDHMARVHVLRKKELEV